MKQEELEARMLQLTWECMKNFWQKNIDEVLRFCRRDITWIGETYHCFGKSLEEIREELFKLSMVKKECRMKREDFHTSICGNTVIITGSYEVSTGEKGETAHFSRQCCSFLWDLSAKQPVICHIHLSTPNGEPNVKEKKSEKLVIRSDNGVVRTISQSDIVYLEAHNKEVMLHLTEGICTIKGGLMENYGLLSENFIKIHRKYIVNLKHITSVKPYAVCTSISEDVPIPARNYRAVRQKIMDALVCL